MTLELDGTNTLSGGYNSAGLQKENGGTLTIGDADKNGSLTATGGNLGAGIGGGHNSDGTGITIPGDTDLLTPLGGGWVLKFDDIAKILG